MLLDWGGRIFASPILKFEATLITLPFLTGLATSALDARFVATNPSVQD